MASRVTAKIGGGEGPWVRLDASASWLWELHEQHDGQVFADVDRGDNGFDVIEVLSGATIDKAWAVRIRAIDVGQGFIAVLVRQPDGTQPV